MSEFHFFQAKRNPWIVMVIFGGSSVVSGLLNLLLPETLGKPLPETLAQVSISWNHVSARILDF
jgi:hypothetical protein